MKRYILETKMHPSLPWYPECSSDALWRLKTKILGIHREYGRFPELLWRVRDTKGVLDFPLFGEHYTDPLDLISDLTV